MTHVTTKEGFHIHFEAEPEHESLKGLFPDDTPEQIAELSAKIDRGEYVYFCAKVSAHKYGLELGTAYLGGCIYDSYEQFYEAKSDYFEDLVAEAITEAKDTIRRLCNE